MAGWLARTTGYLPREYAPMLLLDWRFFVAFGGGSLVCFAAAMAMAIARRRRGSGLGCNAMIGAAIATIFIGVFMVPMLVVLLEIGRSAGLRTIRLGPLIRPIATNPLILSTLLGLAWSLMGLGKRPLRHTSRKGDS